MLDKIFKFCRLAYDKDRNVELTFTFDKSIEKELQMSISTIAQALMGDKKLVLSVAVQKKQRSLNANAYYWQILDQLANILKLDKEQLHLNMLTQYGQTADDGEGNKLIFSLKSHIKPTGILKYSALLGSTTLNGDDFNHYRALKGSSEMDSKEMAILIDGLVNEAKEQGIQVMTPQELSLMCESWGKNE